ncbi:hypothetical protein QBC38DRAFT_364276 [Podospora fimiseda]|uniref:Uncharacterized protein n=1 Tax=Podospora fimiseda TaxID=252190 RepID=A0AAN7BQ71_9PEZI|nr:hypothetical protein QBC38DRAFT_364276 [Podospora fimiseda]
MAGSIIALSLVGLGAVHALPAPTTIEERQIWIGDGGGVLIPGIDQPLPPCLVGGTDAPQPPCLLPFIPGGEIIPGNGGGVEKRQIWIGDGTGIFIPGQGDFPSCLKDVPLKEQKPCLLGPIFGFPKSKRGIQVRQTLIGGGGSVFTPGIGLSPLPICPPGIPLSSQPPCILPPIDGNAPPGTGSTFTPGKRAFKLPPDASTNPKKAIETLETILIHLQNKKHKTKEDKEDIAAIKEALKYLAGIIDIQAPPGTESTFTPGKRAFVLPPDATTNTKKVIERLEKDLIALQNKRYKTKEDLADIKAIKAALFYLAGITNISAPPGTGSTFTPGK